MTKYRSLSVGALATAVLLATGGLTFGVAQAQSRASAAPATAAAHPSRAFWLDARGTPSATSARGTPALVKATSFRALTLDKLSLAGMLQAAPMEHSAAASQRKLVMVLPDPAGGFQRFAVVEAPVMEAGLAERHPDIKTYAGRGIDDPSASLRLSVTPLGVQASVRAAAGAWYVEPYYQSDESVYVSYRRADLPRRITGFTEALIRQSQVSLTRGRYHAADDVRVNGLGFVPNGTVTITVRQGGQAVARQTITATASEDGTLSATFKADPYRALGSYDVIVSDGRSSSTTTYQVVGNLEPLAASVGDQLRVYRLAMVTDPAYANFFGAANVTAAKAQLMTRVNQVYEDELSIRMVLVANNDLLNLNTTALATGANGPCGGAACYTSSQVASCSSSGLTRTRAVIGLLIGASNFDIGHLALGGNGGGIASLGVVGLTNKAQGCTGISPPTGDVFAIDYVAHEMGHQFSGNHTFNGVAGSCSGGNRSAANSVEPGSGSSVMAYAGICGTDNIQLNSDPYFSQRSFDEITTHTSATEQTLNEQQNAVMSGFTTNGQQFQLRYNGNDSAPIVRGTNFTTAGVKAAVEGIAGWPAGATVTVSTLSDNSFLMAFGGTLLGTNVPGFELVNCTGGCTGYVGEIVAGGPSTRRGAPVATGNLPPEATAPAAFTIPLRTPFALTGSAVDPDSDTMTYLWEQNDRGAASGTSLISNTKTNGPLFTQFGNRATFNASVYNPVGQNQTTGSPTRLFPNLPQLLSNNTNAETGVCPTVVGSPTVDQIECYSEFLPTADYAGFSGVNASPARLNFKFTARDGRGGVNSASTVLTLAAGTGPFLVTYPNTAVTLEAGSPVTVTWDVAGTNAAPISAANVKISLSVDGGQTYPYVMAASTPNDGSQKVAVPLVDTTTARLKVEAVGNVFFDISNVDFTVDLRADLTGDGQVDCADLAVVKALLGKRVGDPGFDPRADFNNDGIIDVRDLSYVAVRVTVGERCTLR
jgi:trimeric autotransporter adhesin